jgi:uridine phosphorylase
MPYPNFENKHAHDSMFTPQEFLAYMRSLGRWIDFTPPTGVVLCYQQSLVRHILAVEDVERLDDGPADLYLLRRTDGRVGVRGGFGIGAPAVAVVMEELAALGVKEFVGVGTAGGLQKGCRIGDVVLCSEALRDEGVSHHYLPPARFAPPDPDLTARLRGSLTKAALSFTTGPSWTIDTPYRETVEEARHYQAEGIQTVEMEAAAIFAIAQVRNVAAAAAFVISDSLAELVWDPQFASAELGRQLERLYAAAVDTLAAGA